MAVPGAGGVAVPPHADLVHGAPVLGWGRRHRWGTGGGWGWWPLVGSWGLGLAGGMGLHLADQGLEPGQERRDPGLELRIRGAPGGVHQFYGPDPPFEAAGGRGLTDLPVGGAWGLGRPRRPGSGAIVDRVRSRREWGRGTGVGRLREGTLCEDLSYRHRSAPWWRQQTHGEAPAPGVRQRGGGGGFPGDGAGLPRGKASRAGHGCQGAAVPTGQRRDRRGRAVTWLQAPRQPGAWTHRTGRVPQTGGTGANGMDAGFVGQGGASCSRRTMPRTRYDGTSMAPGGAAREGTGVLQREGEPAG